MPHIPIPNANGITRMASYLSSQRDAMSQDSQSNAMTMPQHHHHHHQQSPSYHQVAQVAISAAFPPPPMPPMISDVHTMQQQLQPGADAVNRDLSELTMSIKRSTPIPIQNNNISNVGRQSIRSINQHTLIPGNNNNGIHNNNHLMLMNHFLIQSDSEVNLLQQQQDGAMNRERGSTIGNVPEIPYNHQTMYHHGDNENDKTEEHKGNENVDDHVSEKEEREKFDFKVMRNIETNLPSHLGIDHLLHAHSPTNNTNITKLTPVTQDGNHHPHHLSSGTCIVHENTPSIQSFVTDEEDEEEDDKNQENDDNEEEDDLGTYSSDTTPTDDGAEIENDTNKLFMQLKEARYSQKKKNKVKTLKNIKKQRKLSKSRTPSFLTRGSSRSHDQSMKTMIIKESCDEISESDIGLITPGTHNDETEDETTTTDDDNKTDFTRYTIMVTQASNNPRHIVGIEGDMELEIDDSKEEDYYLQTTEDENTMEESTEFSFTENTRDISKCNTRNHRDTIDGDDTDYLDDDDDEHTVNNTEDDDGSDETDSEDEGGNEPENVMSVIYTIQKGGGL